MTAESFSPLRVARVTELTAGALEGLLAPFGLAVAWVDTRDIAGSYWGETEAGLIGSRLIVRADTPVHSALHEACHFVCAQRLAGLLEHRAGPGAFGPLEGEIPAAQRHGPERRRAMRDAGGNQIGQHAPPDFFRPGRRRFRQNHAELLTAEPGDDVGR